MAATTSIPSNSFFCFECHFGTKKAAIRQLDAGIDPNSRGALGDTLLFAACRAGKVGVVVLLLERGADPNEPDHYGTTPLMLAARTKKWTIVKLLCDSERIDATRSDITGKTALDYAKSSGNLDIIRAIKKLLPAQ